jgi:tetratricopeptide (TPR) repeat protein
MKGISLGEGQRFFPYFFKDWRIFLLAFLLVYALFPYRVGAQKSEGVSLSRYDRLAEEATLLNKRGLYDQAISLLEPYREDKKNDSALFFNELGIAYRHKGKLSESIQAYQYAFSRDPENPVVMKNLGDALYFNKDYIKAVEQYQKALRSNPRFQQAHSNLGLAYYQLQRYKEAFEEFEIVLQLDPKNEQARKFREATLKKIRDQK